MQRFETDGWIDSRSIQIGIVALTSSTRLIGAIPRATRVLRRRRREGPRADISERDSKKVPRMASRRLLECVVGAGPAGCLACLSRRRETELELRAILRPDCSLGMKLLSSLSSSVPGSPHAAFVCVRVRVYACTFARVPSLGQVHSVPVVSRRPLGDLAY